MMPMIETVPTTQAILDLLLDANERAQEGALARGSRQSLSPGEFLLEYQTIRM
jgi:hypothetical protein